jgi:Fe-S cluster biogenesis protein NfuA
MALAALALPAAASAAAEFPLEVEVTGEGSGNVGCKVNNGPIEGCEASFPEGTKVTVIAEPEAGSELLEWNGDCDSVSGNECKVEMTEAKTIEAVFGLEAVELGVETTGTGEGVVECEVDFGPTEPCEEVETYPYGSEVTLYAEPEEGSEFKEWGGDCTGTEPECALTLEEPLSVSADFEPGPLLALNIEEPGTGEGTISCEANGGPAEPCAPEYPQGTDVKMIAKALPGSKFIEWGGECDVLIGNECALTLDEEKTVEVTFEALPLVSLTIKLAGTGEGKVECKVNGSAAKTCAAEYPEGTELALVATAKPGSKFASYSAGKGSASACSTSPCAFTITAASEVTATFNLAAKFALKVKKTGTGTGKVTSTPAGVDCGATCEAEFDEGTKVTLSQSAEAGSEFVKWTGTCTGSGACEVTMSAAKEVTAEFNLKAKFALKVKKTGTGAGTVTSTPAGISCGATCSAEFESGKEVELKQAAEAGSEFVKWSGACTGTGACKMTMSAAKEVTAEFKLKAKPEFKLTIVKAGTGSGTVTCNATACAATYPEGTEVTLAATVASGSTFAGFSGAGCSGTGPCKVTINADTTVTATFNANSKEETKKEEAKKEEPKPTPEGTAKAAATAKVKSGKAELKLTCSGGPCKGTLRLKAKVKQGKKTKTLVIGKASFSLAEGATATVKVKLSGPAKSELAKGKTLKAKTSGTGIAASTVKLKPAKKK